MSQAHALINLFILLAPFALMMTMVLVIHTAHLYPLGTAWLSLALYGVGFALFITAKLSVIRRGHLISFGSRLMSPTSRWLYRLGYSLMIVAALLTFGLLAAYGSPARGVPRDAAPEGAGRSAPTR